MPIFKNARLLPKRFDGIPDPVDHYTLSSYSAATQIAPYEFGLNTTDNTLVVNFSGTVLTFSPLSGGTLSSTSDIDDVLSIGDIATDKDLYLNGTLTVASGSTTNAIGGFLVAGYNHTYGTVKNTYHGHAILGGSNHFLSGSSTHSGILAGTGTTLNNVRVTTILGGSANSGTTAIGCSVLGGARNLVHDATAVGILFSQDSRASGFNTLVGAGELLSATTCTNALVIGGATNQVLRGTNSVILGGYDNVLSGHTSGTNNLNAMLNAYASQVISTSPEKNTGKENTIIGASGAVLNNCHKSIIIGGFYTSISGATNAIMLGCSSAATADDNTVHVDNLRVHELIKMNATAVPASPENGMIYYDATTGPMIWHGSKWNSMMMP